MINASALLEIDDTPAGTTALRVVRRLLSRLADGLDDSPAEALCERAAQYGDSQPSYAADLRAAADCLA